jgi:hypothetical protein
MEVHKHDNCESLKPSLVDRTIIFPAAIGGNPPGKNISRKLGGLLCRADSHAIIPLVEIPDNGHL